MEVLSQPCKAVSDLLLLIELTTKDFSCVPLKPGLISYYLHRGGYAFTCLPFFGWLVGSLAALHKKGLNVFPNTWIEDGSPAQSTLIHFCVNVDKGTDLGFLSNFFNIARWSISLHFC